MRHESRESLSSAGGGYAFGSQLGDALAAIAAAGSDLKLITIDIGANDVLGCVAAPDIGACLAGALPVLAGNLTFILATLQAAAPGVPIVGMNYYNPNLAFWLTGPEGMALAAASQDVNLAGNGVLEQVYAAFSAPVADVERTFKTFKTRGTPPINVRKTCLFTRMCEKSGDEFVLSDYDPMEPGPQTDIHPSNIGYRRIKHTFVREFKLLGFGGA